MTRSSTGAPVRTIPRLEEAVLHSRLTCIAEPPHGSPANLQLDVERGRWAM